RVTDFHLAHYGARGLGGAGLLMTEMLAVSPEGRITPGCPGLYHDDQIAGWARINALIHAGGETLACAQIGHSGPRGACAAPQDGRAATTPLVQPWPLVAASDRSWGEGGVVPAVLDDAG